MDLRKASDCRLCQVYEDAAQTVVFENEHCVFAQAPSRVGSLKNSGIIIPKKHKETVFDLSPDEFKSTYELLLKVKDWMDREFKPDGYNVGWNCYDIGGQTDMHAHMHVIPRFKQEPLAGKGIRYYLKSEANKW